MKIRQAFVSNSSSSSFVMSKKFLSVYQMEQLVDHINIDLGCGCPEDPELNFPWIIAELGTEVRGSVDMDNFDMEKFLELIGVDMDKVVWDD